MNEKNQGEGDRESGMRYDHDAEKFVKDGNVTDAAEQARRFVEKKPAEAARAEREAKRGPHQTGVDELVDKGRTFFERIRHAVRSRRRH